MRDRGCGTLGLLRAWVNVETQWVCLIHINSWSLRNRQNVAWFEAAVSENRVDNCPRESVVMLDFLMILYGAGFFAVAILYGLACEKM